MEYGTSVTQTGARFLLVAYCDVNGAPFQPRVAAATSTAVAKDLRRHMAQIPQKCGAH